VGEGEVSFLAALLSVLGAEVALLRSDRVSPNALF